MRRKCPAWFQDRLTRVGGRTPHGEPKFKLVWAESETMRDGGYFLKDGYQGYRDVPAIGREQCWALMMWEPAHKCGSPYRWYKDHTDEVTGLVALGQYPHHGRYRVLQKLIHRELMGGEQWITARMEPTHFILDVMVPLIMGWNRMPDDAKVQIELDEQARKEAQAEQKMADARSQIRVSRDGAAVQKRMEIMERGMKQAMAIAARTQRGMIQRGL